MSERILRKTTTHELIERTFTTEPKPKPRTTINISRKGSIVKERCRQLTEMALTLYPDRKIDRDDLTYLITSSIGGDRATIRAYMGYNGYVKHSHTGAFSVVIGHKRKGYLETFGYMHKANLDTWVIHAQTTLPLSSNELKGVTNGVSNFEHEVVRANDISNFSTALKNSTEVINDINKLGVGSNEHTPATPPLLNNECVGKNHSKENFSLSHSLGHAINTERLSDHRGRGDSEWETDSSSKINNNNSERERNFTPMISPKIQRIQPLKPTQRVNLDICREGDATSIKKKVT